MGRKVDKEKLALILLVSLVIFFVGIIYDIDKELEENYKEKYSEDSAAYNIAKNGQEGLENLEEGLKLLKKLIWKLK